MEYTKHLIGEYFEAFKPLELDIRPQLVPKTELRSLAIASATGMIDKLRAYWESTALPDEAIQNDMIQKLSALEEMCVHEN